MLFSEQFNPMLARSRWPVFILIFFSLFFLAFFFTHHSKSGDYLCYERAARKVVQAENPYIGTKYEYPPLMAQIMALAYRVLESSTTGGDDSAQAEKQWDRIFIIYQAFQLLLLISAFVLTRNLAIKIGFKEPVASVIVLTLFVLNVSLYRTLSFNQTNLWILNILLFTILYSDRFPLLSGLLAAFGAQLKLYPFLMLSPWLLMKKYRPIAWMLFGLLAIAFIQTHCFADLVLYKQYAVFFFNDYPSYTQFSNCCLYGILTNSLNFLRWHVHWIETPSLLKSARVLTTVVTFIILIWFTIRALKRERGFRYISAFTPGPAIVEARFLGHAMDMLPLMLLVAPSIWEHHFILIMPFALWAFALAEKKRYPALFVSLGLVFLVPVIAVFPWGYHRLIGLLVLIYLTDKILPKAASNVLESKGF